MRSDGVLAASAGRVGDIGLVKRSPLWPRFVAAALPLTSPSSSSEVEHLIGGHSYRIAQPITFTPFFSVRPCSARCRFCSETLVHRAASALSSTLRPGAGYFNALRRVLVDLRGLPLGLSLSGLEATDDADWLCRLLDTLDEHLQAGGIFEHRVLYTNGNGLTRAAGGARLLERLLRFGITRVEMSRHHPDAERNAAIMRFRKGMPAGRAEDFEQAVADTLADLPVRLVCVVQRGGVDSGMEVRRYLDWATQLGVTDVVFRELARLGELYRPNASRRYVDQHRVAIEDLIAAFWPNSPRAPTAGGAAANAAAEDLQLRSLHAGYYYWSLACRWRDQLSLAFETSDYSEMKARHHGARIHKLIFHANGNLCADWDPHTRVLLALPAAAR